MLTIDRHFDVKTRFGPNRPAAEIKGDGGVDSECFIAWFYLISIIQMPVFPISEFTVFL